MLLRHSLFEMSNGSFKCPFFYSTSIMLISIWSFSEKSTVFIDSSKMASNCCDVSLVIISCDIARHFQRMIVQQIVTNFTSCPILLLVRTALANMIWTLEVNTVHLANLPWGSLTGSILVIKSDRESINRLRNVFVSNWIRRNKTFWIGQSLLLLLVKLKLILEPFLFWWSWLRFWLCWQPT